MQNGHGNCNVVFDSNNKPPRSFYSWRGVGEELTLVTLVTLVTFGGSSPITVSDLLEKADTAKNGTFEGYKGGWEYQMTPKTPLWADNYGDYKCNAVVGVEIYKNQCIIVTQHIDDSH